MKKIILLLLAMAFGAKATPVAPVMVAGLEAEIRSLKEQIIKNGGTPKEYYPNQDYIESHYPNASADKKKHLREKYSRSDAKSGIFMGINVGYGALFNDYIDGHYNETTTTIPDLQTQKTGVLKSPLNTISKLPMFGGKLGYQSFFNPYFGARVYGDVMIASGGLTAKNYPCDDGSLKDKKIGSVIYMLGAMNLDLLVDVPLDRGFKYFVGGYFGIGFGAMVLLDSADKDEEKTSRLLKDPNYSSDNVLWNTLLQIDYTFNAGLAFTINAKNRLEVGAKIPWNFLRLGLESPATYSTASGASKTLESKDIAFKRSVIWTASYIYVF
ncbi:outer membrane beta-barrel protein [Helicobacter sp. 11S02596-1]|uniref:outer membrane beta-barrel protein n=1 Tax=Helicobacter sp. 11S02596-1 TaxID=1476194 RepID=UPI000BC3F1FA|nr:outer membrane beta-barrel protein [Helicobacter sp. 11S02596-1]PAF43195.1 hypothetical protein BJI48_05475 [Helicobacter sp. 11S02596-1]